MMGDGWHMNEIRTKCLLLLPAYAWAHEMPTIRRRGAKKADIWVYIKRVLNECGNDKQKEKNNEKEKYGEKWEYCWAAAGRRTNTCKTVDNSERIK